jgi:uncharacterized membrane protein YdbT with pleckstrin-like domain
MRTLKCPECGKTFNETEKACPNCGCPSSECLEKKKTENKFGRITLLPGETVVASAKFRTWPFIILCAIVAIICFILIDETGIPGPFIPWIIISVLYVILLATSSWAMYFIITNKRVIAHYGLLIWVSFELKIEKVESITIYRGLFGRIFKCGRVRVCGVGASKVTVPFVKRPSEFRQHFFDMQYAEKQSPLN